MPWRKILLLGVALLLGGATDLPGQELAQATLRGRITADSGRGALEGVEVRIEGYAIVARSDSGGRYIFSALRPGVVTILIRYPGFQPVRDSIRLEPGTETERNISLVRLPTTLAAVKVVEEGGVPNPALRDFERRSKGTGKFLRRDDIERLGTKSLESVIRSHIGGFSLVRLPNGGMAVAGKRGNELSLTPRPAREPGLADRCYSQIFVNGQRIYAYQSPPSMPPRLDDFDIDRIAAIEFYRGPAETPSEFSGPSAACGTVAIWAHIMEQR